MSHLTYAEAMVVGLIQGVTELFPVSSLGHNVLIPALVGGQWAQDLNVSEPNSPYLAFIVGLHVATGIAMIIYFWRDWLRIVGGFFASVGHVLRPEPGTRRWEPQNTDQMLAWMIIVATIPVGDRRSRAASTCSPRCSASPSSPRYSWRERAHPVRRRVATAPHFGRHAVREASVPAAPAGASSALARERAVAARPGPRSRPGAPRAGTLGRPRQRRRRRRGRPAARKRPKRLCGLTAVWPGWGSGRSCCSVESQILALLPGISRDGMVTVSGMFRGLSQGGRGTVLVPAVGARSSSRPGCSSCLT